MLLNNEWVNNEIKEQIKKYLETNENEHPKAQNLWDTEKGILRVYINTSLPKKEKNFKKQLNPTTTRTRGTTNKTQSEQKEGNKIRAELNDKETKKTIQKIKVSRS